MIFKRTFQKMKARQISCRLQFSGFSTLRIFILNAFIPCKGVAEYNEIEMVKGNYLKMDVHKQWNRKI